MFIPAGAVRMACPQFMKMTFVRKTCVFLADRQLQSIARSMTVLAARHRDRYAGGRISESKVCSRRAFIPRGDKAWLLPRSGRKSFLCS